MSDFPWRSHTRKELLDDYFKLISKIENTGIKFPLPYLRTGLKCSNYFFQYERMKTRSQGKISCYDFWKKNKNKVIASYDKDTTHGDIFTKVNFMNHPPSQFPPMVACQLYKYFGATKVLDPYAGWGDRCVAAMAMDIDYIGIDSNKNLRKPYQDMIKYYPSKSNVKMFFQRSENIDIDELDFDFVLTSPPFWNKSNSRLLEVYNGSEPDYKIFIQQSLIPLIQKVLIKNIKI